MVTRTDELVIRNLNLKFEPKLKFQGGKSRFRAVAAPGPGPGRVQFPRGRAMDELEVYDGFHPYSSDPYLAAEDDVRHIFFMQIRF